MYGVPCQLKVAVRLSVVVGVSNRLVVPQFLYVGAPGKVISTSLSDLFGRGQILIYPMILPPIEYPK